MKVPSGPRKPMRRRAVESASSVTRRNATDVDEAALVALLEAVRSGDLHPDDAVRRCAATIYRFLLSPKGAVGNWSNLAITSQPHILNGPRDFRQ